MGDDDTGGSANDADTAVELTAVEGKQPDRVVASGAVGRHRVERTIAGRTAERACEIDQHATGRQISPAEVVDHDVVGAAEGVEIDPLDAVKVHGDGGDVAGETHAPAVGRDVDVLVDVGAIEHERVESGLTLDRVAAVAGVPDEGVVAGAEGGEVVAAAADHSIVA